MLIQTTENSSSKGIKTAKRFGVKLFCMRLSSVDKIAYREFAMMRNPNPVVETQEAPFEIEKREKVRLRIFLDKSVPLLLELEFPAAWVSIIPSGGTFHE